MKPDPSHHWTRTLDGDTRCTDCDCRFGGEASKKPCTAKEPQEAK